MGGLALGAASGVNIVNVGAVPDPLAGAYGVSLATVGLFTTALLVAHTAVQIPGGRAVDRFGARRMGLLLLAVGAAGNALITIAAEPALVLGLRPVVGLSTGIGFVAGIDYIRAAGGSALAQGIFGGVAMGGGGLALAAVPQLEPALDWRAPFVFGIAVSVAAACVLLLGPRDARAAGPAPKARVTALEIATDRRLARLVVLHTATFGSGLLIGTWVVALLVRATASNSSRLRPAISIPSSLRVALRPPSQPRTQRASMSSSLPSAARTSASAWCPAASRPTSSQPSRTATEGCSARPSSSKRVNAPWSIGFFSGCPNGGGVGVAAAASSRPAAL